MRTLIAGVAALLLLGSSLASSQVLEVNIWKPKMGGSAGTLAAAKEAKAIIARAGGNASIGVDLDGSLHFVTNHENWAGWAAQTAKLEKDAAWTSFIAKWNADPSAELIENYLLNTPAPGEDGPVYQVFIWEPELGRGGDLLQAAMQAKMIHEKAGAAITIHLDQMQNMHYVMNFASWEAWGKFNDTPNQEFLDFMQKQSADPTGRIVKVYTASMQ